jgi:hypothetical protein
LGGLVSTRIVTWFVTHWGEVNAFTTNPLCHTNTHAVVFHAVTLSLWVVDKRTHTRPVHGRKPDLWG